MENPTDRRLRRDSSRRVVMECQRAFHTLRRDIRSGYKIFACCRANNNVTARFFFGRRYVFYGRIAGSVDSRFGEIAAVNILIGYRDILDPNPPDRNYCQERHGREFVATRAVKNFEKHDRGVKKNEPVSLGREGKGEHGMGHRNLVRN